jgi:hypothetical protein
MSPEVSVLQYPSGMRVISSEQTSPGRGTGRRCHMALSESYAFGYQTVKVRGIHIGKP